MDPTVVVHNFITIAEILETVSIIIGIGLFLGGMFMLKRYGETRTMMSHQMTLAGPFMMIFSGVMFLILPTTIATFLNAFWGTWNPLSYGGTGQGWDAYMPAVIIFVRVIGIGSIMRGLLLLSRSGGHHGQPGSAGRAFVHIFAGILMVHIIGTVHLLDNILDWSY